MIALRSGELVVRSVIATAAPLQFAACVLLHGTRESLPPVPPPNREQVMNRFCFVPLVALCPLALSAEDKKEPPFVSKDGKFQVVLAGKPIEKIRKVKIGDRELVGNVSSISLGGVQVNTDALLENGGIVTMSIRSPDGTDNIQVEGKIVWSEEQKRYGVAFANAEENALAAISRWTQSLIRL